MSRFVIPLSVLLIVAVLGSGTIAISIGMAHVLHWLVPTFDLNTSTFIVLAALMFWGVLGFGFALATVALSQSNILQRHDDDDGEPDDLSSEISELQADRVADRLYEAISKHMDLKPRRRTRRPPSNPDSTKPTRRWTA